MKIKDRIKKVLNIKNLVTWNIILWSISHLLNNCTVALERFIYSCKDLYHSLVYWGRFVYQGAPADVGSFESDLIVNDIPDVNIQEYLPFDIIELQHRFETLHLRFLDIDNFNDFNLFFVQSFYWLVLFILILVIAWLMIFYVFGDMICDETGLENGHFSPSYSKALVGWFKFVKPCSDMLLRYFTYLKTKVAYIAILALIWGLCLNVFTIVFEFFSYYFFMLCGFDFNSFWTQILKLTIDLIIMFSSAPWWAWLLMVIIVYSIYAVYRGYDNLRRGEASNCGIAKEFNYCLMFSGPMGLGKTALATDIALSYNNIFKTDAHDIIFKYDLMFPLFSWELFEKDIAERISSGQIYNLPCVDIFVDELSRVYERTPSMCFLYGYNFEKYPMKKDIGTYEVSLFDAMKEYARALFAYSNDNPNLANYSIRLDGYHDESPYFKKWCGDFFVTDKSKSKYCHILDQDMMRLGKRVKPDNPLCGSFGFGIYNNTEWGKSRLNQVNSEGIKKDSEETNQKNDLYDYLIKLCRHASVMIDNKVFFRFIADEQRPESIPASLRDVVTVIQIVDKSKIKLALPGFKLFDLIYDNVYSPFKDFYYEYRNNRGDRTLPVLFLKAIMSAFSNFYLKIYNTFGYFDVELKAEDGTAYGNQGESASGAKTYIYQLAVKKIYSQRYATDCYQQFFEKQQLETLFGINNLPTYGSLKMTVEEMKQQHDYFLMEIMGIMLGEVSPNKDVHTKKKQRACEEPSFSFAVQEF